MSDKPPFENESRRELCDKIRGKREVRVQHCRGCGRGKIYECASRTKTQVNTRSQGKIWLGSRLKHLMTNRMDYSWKVTQASFRGGWRADISVRHPRLWCTAVNVQRNDGASAAVCRGHQEFKACAASSTCYLPPYGLIAFLWALPEGALTFLDARFNVDCRVLSQWRSNTRRLHSLFPHNSFWLASCVRCSAVTNSCKCN